MNEHNSTPEHHRLYQALLRLQTEEECAAFLEDICTIKELSELAKRLEVARLLSDGQSYVKISAMTGVSTATISRVNRCLSFGSGGYAKALDGMKGETEET